MKEEKNQNEKEKLMELCNQVRLLINDRKYEECEKMITDSMKKYPHAPEPHNLMGMFLEVDDNHLLAMKHFKAAWALDPTYLPSRHNLEAFGTFFSKGEGAYDETDCPALEEKVTCVVEYDEKGIGHIVRRKK